MKIDGLDKLGRELKDAEEAFAGMDGEFGTVSFDLQDPASIDAAIQEMERLVDERVGRYASNSLVGPMAEQMKESFRESLLEKAAAARLSENNAE
ncbi:hypothetical protein DYI37_19050 [Fulvimarina endophytica]|uniref:Uncharacterized protein n=1 Tax=Fulvimarina endophytica TaxID=2293836 RepID=A0A371WY21_9HYPH|nr:hypothetical protein [Fulvimarina endophytica]RFC61849.1 hypothetical protein DYI37_19050 [Fulvimarina endophytica]